ncbi:hypothetical protein [Okeania sp. SIO2B9]|uniref:hypothetical protein n=1 Tax=Microcoleaceae TaxID=1892252 RepID=UPI00142A8B32|nr:hypothetical protein [Okeania sp. SIO2B9]NES89784.1 hypothetical protein [Okeania sp. SIO2B9]
MKPRKLLNLATTFPIVSKRKLFKNLLLYPTALLTALSLTFLIQEKTNSQLNINTEIFYNVKVCNEYKKKIFVARAKQRAYLVAGDRNYGNPYGVRLEVSKVRGWGPVLPNECQGFPILKLDVEPPKNSRYLGTQDWIYIMSSDKKKFPRQDITSYRNSQGGNSVRPEFCVINKVFNLSSRNYQKTGTRICPGYNVNKKSTLPEGTDFVRFEPVSPQKDKIVFR